MNLRIRKVLDVALLDQMSVWKTLFYKRANAIGTAPEKMYRKSNLNDDMKLFESKARTKTVPKAGSESHKEIKGTRKPIINNFSTILNSISKSKTTAEEIKDLPFNKMGERTEKKKLFQGKNINSNMITVSFLPKNWTEEDVTKYFDPMKTLLEKIILLKTGNGFNCCKALLEFKSLEACRKFLKEWEDNFYDIPSCLQRMTIKMFSLEGMILPQMPSAQVYINNIDFYTSKEDLLDIASKFGEIESVEVPLKANKKNKGHAFITFKDKTQAMKFVEFADNLSINKRKIRLQFSNMKTNDLENLDLFYEKIRKELDSEIPNEIKDEANSLQNV